MAPSPLRKILTPEGMSHQAQLLRAAGKTIVHCHGCFDIVHPGHIRYLQFARQLGDVLLVSLTGDALVSKGPDRPYIPQELRAENLAVLEFVDFVVVDPHPTACELLELIQPDVYVKGREYAGANDPRFAREKEIVERGGGRVIFHSGDIVFSSTNLLRSLARDQQLDEHRLRVMCQRHGIDSAAAHATLDAFADVPVVVVGDLIREHYVICDATGTASDGPSVVLRRLGEESYWCGAAAVALQLRALGANPTLIAAVGSDAESRTYESRLAELGVSTVLLPIRPTVASRRTYVADDTKLFKVDESPALPLDSTNERHVARLVTERLRDARLLMWCDHGLGMVTPGLVHAVWQGLKAEKRPLVTGMATGPQADLLGLSGADLVTATERQVREAAHDMTSGLPAVAWKLLHSLASPGLLVSLRKRGLMSFRAATAAEISAEGSDRLKSDFVPSQALFYVDQLGAEESLLATASLALACAAPGAAASAEGRAAHLPLAAYLATAAEAICVSRPGSRHVKAQELRDWLSQRAELRPESRFQPDAATVVDLARIAPPFSLPSGRDREK